MKIHATKTTTVKKHTYICIKHKYENEHTRPRARIRTKLCEKRLQHTNLHQLPKVLGKLHNSKFLCGKYNSSVRVSVTELLLNLTALARQIFIEFLCVFE